MAPADTALAIHLFITPDSYSFLNETLAGVPLVSERSLELADLAQLIQGEFAVFITKQGKRSLAIRANSKSLPDELLQLYSISSQTKGPFVLLSNTLVPIVGTEPSITRPFSPSLENQWIGHVIIPDEQRVGSIFITKNGLTLVFQTPKHLPEVGHRSSDDLSVSWGNLSWLQEGPTLLGLERLLLPLLDEELAPFFLRYDVNMRIAIRETREGKEVALLVKGSNLSPEDLIRELQRIGALAKPSVKRSTLPDGSFLEEIEVLPDLVSVEEISTALGLSYRVGIGTDSWVMTAIYKDWLFLSNSQGLMEDLAHFDEGDTPISCTTHAQFINPAFLLSQVSSSTINPDFGLISKVLDDFTGVSIELDTYSTRVHLCRT